MKKLLLTLLAILFIPCYLHSAELNGISIGQKISDITKYKFETKNIIKNYYFYNFKPINEEKLENLKILSLSVLSTNEVNIESFSFYCIASNDERDKFLKIFKPKDIDKPEKSVTKDGKTTYAYNFDDDTSIVVWVAALDHGNEIILQVNSLKSIMKFVKPLTSGF